MDVQGSAFWEWITTFLLKILYYDNDIEYFEKLSYLRR